MSRHRNKGILALKIIAWVIGCLIVIAGCIIGGFAIYLSPQRITRLIEEKSSEYLDAQIHITGLDYKIFSTYPWLHFEIDSLTVISKSLDKAPQQDLKQLPSYTDSLFSVGKISGMVNVHSLMHDNLYLKNLEIQYPHVNIVMVNDSINNFNIAPNISKPSKIPEFNLGEIRIITPVKLNFFSLEEEVDASVEVDDFYFDKTGDKSYGIGFKGNIGGSYQDYRLPRQIPVEFHTTVTPHFPKMNIDLSNLSLAYSGIRVNLEGDISIDKTNIILDKTLISVTVEDLFSLINDLPDRIKSEIPMEGINGFLPVSIIASLQAPFWFNVNNQTDFTLSDLPAFETILNITDANLTLTPPKGKRVEADDVFLEAKLNFDPENPDETSLILQELRCNGEGIELSGEAEISNLTGENQIFDCRINIETPLMQSLAYFMPKSPVKITGYLNGNIKASGSTGNFGKDGFQDLKISGKMSSHNLKVKSGKAGDLNLKNMKSDFKAIVPRFPFNNNYSGLKLDFGFSSDSLFSVANGTDVRVSKFHLAIDAMDTVSGNPDPFGSLVMTLNSLEAASGGNDVKANKVSLKANGSLNSNGPGSYSSVSPTSGEEDALIASRVPHTPLVLEYSGGGILQTIMGMLNLDADLKIEKADFNTPEYLFPIEINNLLLSTNLNKINFSAGNIRLARTGFAINGEFNGLMPFLTSYSATPLDVKANINFSNVDINQLSWGYYGALIAQGKDSVFYVAPMEPLTAADSVCVAIPRNITADINLYSDAAEYMQYKFAPLSTSIIVKDGVATLSKLTVGAPYATAIVDWTYSTAALNNIFMDLQATVKDFRFAPFYEVFPSLTQKTPEIHNFTGEINANIGCHFIMYPDMFMNGESLNGKFDIKGTQLQFARQGKIERITHLMLIDGDEPIQIQNLNIKGTFHDNLLEVMPFRVNFDDYQLAFSGVNNLAGDMYYHIALEKSPFHLPFGVGLQGKMKHPEIRLGGTHPDNYQAEKVAAVLSSHLNANIMAYLHHGWLLFVTEAAKFENEHLPQPSK